MKQLPKLEFLIRIFSVVAALVSIIVIGIEFINIKPNILGLMLAVLGSIVGALIAYGIGQFADKKFTKKVFISHSMQDSDFVSKLTKDLTRTGFQVLSYDSVILVGDNIKEKISNSIRNSDFFLIVLSKDSTDSSWVSNELDLAIENNKRIFPVLKDKIDLPTKLEPIQYADFTSDYDSAVSRLLKSLRASQNVSRSTSA